MTAKFEISIILCTKDRASDLASAMASLGEATVPAGMAAELIVVDNGSNDRTPTVVQNSGLPNLAVRYIYEPQPGKSRALNAGLAASVGDFILFSDDDVRVSRDWIESMVGALATGTCDAVTGRIDLAPELERPWMTSLHRWWLACSEAAELNEGNRELIGASMGFRRRVLERVPAFEVELGPGALGLAEDTLFGWQLVEAGYKIAYEPVARVVHRPEASRLARRSWLNEGRKHARCDAYILHHWKHGKVSVPRLQWLWLGLKLHLRRILQRPGGLDTEGCATWEISYDSGMALCQHFLIERKRPRQYDQRGVQRRQGYEKELRACSIDAQ